MKVSESNFQHSKTPLCSHPLYLQVHVNAKKARCRRVHGVIYNILYFLILIASVALDEGLNGVKGGFLCADF